jgi:GH24 family phage-related lysozyme (muramidase)
MSLFDPFSAGPFASEDEFRSFKTDEEEEAHRHGYVANVVRTDKDGEIYADVTYALAAPAITADPAAANIGGTAASTAQQEAQEDADFEKLLALREGRRKDVYLDSLGKPTVGIGHLIVAGDNLKLGDRITDEQVTALFKKDSAPAMRAARAQALEAGITDSSFIPYLASVNFQLGTKWTGTFPRTWRMIVDGKYEDAAAALNDTLWAKQTPVRVKDFEDALRRLPPKQ